MGIRKEKIKVYDMTCTSCEARVENAALKNEGVLKAKASFAEQYLDIEYDDEKVKIKKIKEEILSAGYSTEKSDLKFFGILIIAAAVAILGFNTRGFDMEGVLQNASYGVLFLAGVLTSIHCVGMCGGIMLTQSISANSSNKFEAIKPTLLYNIGRVISYTILGAVIGAAGSAFSLSIKSKAAVQIIAGAFMIMMGFNMAGFGLFRKFQLHMPKSFCKIKSKQSSPFVVGLLNGLMPCGPLQTMQIFALGTSSPVKGALAMFAFSLGTVPLMIAFGGLSGLLSKGYTKRLLKMSGVLVIVLGLIMGNRGFAIAGITPANVFALDKEKVSDVGENTNPNVAKAVMEDGVQVIKMTVNNQGFVPNAFYVQKGIPVKWIIDGKDINTCNNAIIIPSMDMQKVVKSGENIIEFTPSDKDISFSCWMGMIGGLIRVVERLDTVDTTVEDPSLPAPAVSPDCCKGPIEQEQADLGKESIYGDDIKKTPTEMLIGKAEENSITIKGIGYELQPLISVVKSNETIEAEFDLDEFDDNSGEFLVVDGNTGGTVASFDGSTGSGKVEFTAVEDGIYGIIKDGAVLGVVKTVDDLESADLEEIRNSMIIMQ
jgi:sulfite exporter TauE/SafE/plastocyanin domain-containing protein/copper chaperone CopZ